MEFFDELPVSPQTMKTFNYYDGKYFLDESPQSFPVPSTPPHFFPLYEFDVENFSNSENIPLPYLESPISNPCLHQEPDFIYNPKIPTSLKQKGLPFHGPSRDDTRSVPNSNFSSNHRGLISKKRKILLLDPPREQLQEQEQEHEQLIHRDQLLEVSRSSEDADYAGSENRQGMLLIHLLAALAEAMSNDTRDLAEVILLRLRKLVSSTGSNIERIGFYFYHAFNWRFTGKNELDVKPHLVPHEDFLLAYRVLIEIYPCSRLAQFTANQCFLEAIPKDSKKLHVLDFDLIDGLQWPPLMEALVSEGFSVKHIRLTSIKWTNSSENSSIRTSNRLREFAEELGFDFWSEEVELENLVKNLTEEEEEEEVVVVNCMFKLFHMLERSTWQVYQFLEKSKNFYPRIFTLSYCNFSEEDGCVDLMDRLVSCLQCASAVCDSLESALPTQQLARQTVERLFLGPRFCRELMFENSENPIRHVPYNLGLVRGRVSPQNLEQGRDLLRLQAREGHFYQLETVNHNEISLRWGETSLLSTSAWHVW